MNKLPKVSIVIPVYNGSAYLKEAIESALNQTYENFEVLVVNDGSDDQGASKEIAKAYGKKIRYFEKKNSGVGSALNYGIGKMKGEWFSWLSHDDVYYPDKLKRQIEFVLKQKEARFIISAFVNIDKSGKVYKDEVSSWKPKPKIQTRELLGGNKFSGCASLIHEECFKEAGLFNEKNLITQDYELWLKMSLRYQFFYCPGIVLKRRWHKNMGSLVRAKQMSKDTKLVLEEFDKKMKIENLFKDKLGKKPTNQEVAKCEVELADLYLSNHPELAQIHYRKARKLWPYWKNPGYKRLLTANWLGRGLKNWGRIYWRLKRAFR